MEKCLDRSFRQWRSDTFFSIRSCRIDITLQFAENFLILVRNYLMFSILCFCVISFLKFADKLTWNFKKYYFSARGIDWFISIINVYIVYYIDYKEGVYWLAWKNIYEAYLWIWCMNIKKCCNCGPHLRVFSESHFLPRKSDLWTRYTHRNTSWIGLVSAKL